MMNSWAERARQTGTPLLDGNMATFVWRGKKAPQLMGDFNGWENGVPLELTQVGEQTWIHSMELPLDTYMEYAFVKDGKRYIDPLNERTTPNGIGKINNYFYMTNGKKTALARRKPEIKRGKVEKITLKHDFFFTNGKRSAWLYQPPVDGPVPLVVVWDGAQYLERIRVHLQVDRLIAEKRIRPIALAMIDSGGPLRMWEYNCADATLGSVFQLLIPEAQKRLDLIDIKKNPGAFGVMGASMGGLMSLYAGLRCPEVFGSVLSQSGAYDFDGWKPVVWPLLDGLKKLPFKLFMDVGTFEWLLEPNRSLHAMLQSRKMSHEYREFHGGHNSPAWRDDLGYGLEYLWGTKASQ